MPTAKHPVEDPACEVFIGNLTTVSAEVFVELRFAHPTPYSEDVLAQVAGWVEGPWSATARTLVSRSPLQRLRCEQGETESVCLFKALIPDPCFWSVGLPHLYRVRLNLPGDGTRQIRREIGLRPLATSGRRINWAGKNWVVRGVEPTAIVAGEGNSAADLTDWIETDTALVLGTTAAATDVEVLQLAEAASTGGAMVIQTVPEKSASSSKPDLWTLPGVAMAWLTGHSNHGVSLRRTAPNLLLVQVLESAETEHAA